MRIILDGEKIQSKQSLYDVLFQSLELPKDYGRNLDAISEYLTDPGSPVEIVLRNTAGLKKALQGYYVRLLFMLTDTMHRTARLKVTMEE